MKPSWMANCGLMALYTALPGEGRDLYGTREMDPPLAFPSTASTSYPVNLVNSSSSNKASRPRIVMEDNTCIISKGECDSSHTPARVGQPPTNRAFSVSLDQHRFYISLLLLRAFALLPMSSPTDDGGAQTSLQPSADITPESGTDNGTYGSLAELRVELEDCLSQLVTSLFIMSWKGTFVQMDPSFCNLSSLVMDASNMLTVMTLSMIYPDSPVIVNPSSMTLMFPLDTFGPKSVVNLLDEVLYYLTELTEELGILPDTFLSDVGTNKTGCDLPGDARTIHDPRRQLLNALMSEIVLHSVVPENGESQVSS
ncbi:hypothetical protein OBBRIDRAFT_589452 [Obba rivulosa]|uniref:Uncharacterized protein n=1 Tax=Obba rivulosa TaxID=1052685 RepID=A0A8E2AYU2_9APHY|nr:hypothetical protein OBBRIDRAFT_589452 [Obba rivulosa]